MWKSELRILLSCFGILIAMAAIVTGVVYLIGSYFFWPDETMELVTYSLFLVGLILIAKYV